MLCSSTSVQAGLLAQTPEWSEGLHGLSLSRAHQRETQCSDKPEEPLVPFSLEVYPSPGKSTDVPPSFHLRSHLTYKQELKHMFWSQYMIKLNLSAAEHCLKYNQWFILLVLLREQRSLPQGPLTCFLKCEIFQTENRSLITALTGYPLLQKWLYSTSLEELPYLLRVLADALIQMQYLGWEEVIAGASYLKLWLVYRKTASLLSLDLFLSWQRSDYWQNIWRMYNLLCNNTSCSVYSA